ncbi:MAG: cytochrome c oxidase subunit 3 [Tepidisphaeraceae bacterium]
MDRERPKTRLTVYCRLSTIHVLNSKPHHRPPPAAGTIAMWLFLAALTMLFGASLLGYFMIRTRDNAPALHTLVLPRTLWISTALMLGCSVTIHQAVVAVRRERQNDLRRNLAMTCVFAAGFVVIQTPALIKLLSEHQVLLAQRMHLYGLVFFLVLVHALHVLGGIIGLAVTTKHAAAGLYDHENFAGVKYAAMYWHFLDVVWIVLYAGLTLAG